MLMGGPNYKGWSILWMMFYISLSQIIQCMDASNSTSLDRFVYDYANKAIQNPVTGTIYNMTLPTNFSGMEVSIIRFRSRTFYMQGVNFNLLHIPPGNLPLPFVRRLEIVYKNLGNWSSYYYDVPSYTFVTPIVGYLLYDASNSTTGGAKMIGLGINGVPISVQFDRISLPEGANGTMQCVRFGTDGFVQFSHMTIPSSCTFRDQGHFAIMVPTPPPKRDKLWEWWVIGFAVGIGGLILLGLVVFVVIKMIKFRKVSTMERQSERGEPLETTWVGNSRMPSASGVRTQPALDNECVC